VNDQPTVLLLFVWVRGRRQAHNPTLAKIMRLAYTRKHSNTPPQTAACNAVWKNGSRTLMIARLEHQVLLPRQVSMRSLLRPAPYCIDTLALQIYGSKNYLPTKRLTRGKCSLC
jgi:hypothetical protein